MRTRRLVVLPALVLLSGLLMGASWFGGNGDEEISPLQYSALLGLRDVDNKLFVERLMPIIEKAMADGRITGNELAEIEKAAGSVGPAFFMAAREPRMQDRLRGALDKAQKEGRDLGDKLGGAFMDMFEGLKEPAKPAPKEGVPL